MGLREKLLARRELKRERVEVPGLDEPVFVRQMSPREKDDYEAGRYDFSGKRPKLDFTNTRASLVAACACDEGGKLIFSERDIDALGEVSPEVVEALFAAAQKLNGLGGKDEENELKNGQPSSSPTA